MDIEMYPDRPPDLPRGGNLVRIVEASGKVHLALAVETADGGITLLGDPEN